MDPGQCSVCGWGCSSSHCSAEWGGWERNIQEWSRIQSKTLIFLKLRTHFSPPYPGLSRKPEVCCQGYWYLSITSCQTKQYTPMSLPRKKGILGDNPEARNIKFCKKGGIEQNQECHEIHRYSYATSAFRIQSTKPLSLRSIWWKCGFVRFYAVKKGSLREITDTTRFPVHHMLQVERQSKLWNAHLWGVCHDNIQEIMLFAF